MDRDKLNREAASFYVELTRRAVMKGMDRPAGIILGLAMFDLFADQGLDLAAIRRLVTAKAAGSPARKVGEA